MNTITEALESFLQDNQFGKMHNYMAAALKNWVVRNKRMELTLSNLTYWVSTAKTKSTKTNRGTFIRCLVNYCNTKGFCEIPIPINLDKKEQQKVNKEKQPLCPSPVSDLLERYITYCRAAGTMGDTTHQCLRYFNDYCANNYSEEKVPVEEMVADWCSKRNSECNSSFNKRIAPIRSFLRYTNRVDQSMLELPEYLPYDKKKFVPHPYSKEELRKLFYAADHLSTDSRYYGFQFKVRKMIIPVMLRLLYSTGMRTCEATKLSCKDVDLEYGVINIENTKGYDQHRVALHKSMWNLLLRYEEEISKLIPNRTAFFPNEFGNFLGRTWITYHFGNIWKQISNEPARVYDLRSNYAVTNINSWKYIGPEWFDKLLYLSRTMGHSCVASTTYYYNLVPLFAEQLYEMTESDLTEILPDLSDYYAFEKE